MLKKDYENNDMLLVKAGYVQTNITASNFCIACRVFASLFSNWTKYYPKGPV
jgi:hypothetical protein